jgi:hypothetical protein
MIKTCVILGFCRGDERFRSSSSIGFTETSVCNFQYTQRSIKEKRITNKCCVSRLSQGYTFKNIYGRPSNTKLKDVIYKRKHVSAKNLLSLGYSSFSLWRWTWQRVPKHRQNLIRLRGKTQKKTYKMIFGIKLVGCLCDDVLSGSIKTGIYLLAERVPTFQMRLSTTNTYMQNVYRI